MDGRGSFLSTDGASLYYRRRGPDAEPRANLALVHGLGGHSGLFLRLMDQLAPLGYACYAVDLRGHGRSPGSRGHIRAWGEFRHDVDGLIRMMERHGPETPWFVLGHSLGATIVLDYAVHRCPPPRGIVAIAPALGQVAVPPWKLWLGRTLSWCWPRFTLQTGLDANLGTRDPAWNEANAADPLSHTQGSARLATEFLSAVRRVRRQAKLLHAPLLILHGGADQATSPVASRAFFDAVPSKDKEFREYPDAYHELHNDLNHREVTADLANWLDGRINRQDTDRCRQSTPEITCASTPPLS